MSGESPVQLSERRVVTVLFADVAGFTAMVERLDPEAVTDAMNDVFAALGGEVEAVGGHVDKVIGDSLMALFGAPVAHEDDAARAVRAALGMHRAVAARQDALQRILGQPVRLRIGIHMGQVVWGTVGPPGQARPTVMGDVVNLASRLQRAAPEGGVLVSDAVCRQVRGTYHCRALEPIVVKGKAEPVAVYEILGERDRAEPMERAAFVDRQQELAQLEDLMARTRRGRAQVIIVTGDAGVGKTRLVEEFTARLPSDVVLLATACPPYGGQSLGPLADVFRQFAGLTGPMTVGEVAARIPMGERAERAAAILSRLFNLTEVSTADVVSHDTAWLVAAEAIRSMLTHQTVVWIEDLQWADAGTRELLPYIVERLNDTPLLLVGTQRAGEDPLVWGRRTAMTTMQLDPLSDEDARALLAAIAGERLPEEAERTLIAKAGGNPFYLSELLAALRGLGVLVMDDRGHWRAVGPVEQVVPDTIQGALLARLDRLSPDHRTLLQRAAVVGISSRQSLLARLAAGVDVVPLMEQLEDAYLLRRHDPLAADPEFVFIHPLLREVAYGSLVTKHRAALHQEVAEAMEALYPDQLDDLAKTIGIHHDRGGAADRALPLLLQAARRAAQQYAVQEAVELLERARVLAEATGNMRMCVEVCELLGELYPRVQQRGPKAWFEVWQQVLTHADPAAEPVRVARAAIRAAHARQSDNQPAEAWDLLARAEAIIPEDHPLWGDYHSVRGATLILESKYREALEAARQAVDIADRRGSPQDRSRAYAVLGHPAILPLMGEEGRRVMRAWVAEAVATGDERIITDARHFFISDIWTRGSVDQDVLPMAEETARRAADHGWTRDEAGLRLFLGWGNFLVGRWPDAHRHLQRAHDLVEVHGGRTQGGVYLILLPLARGNLAMGYGRLDEARAIFEDALTRAHFHAPIWLNHDLARSLWMLGDEAGARAAMERSLEARDRLRCIICGCQANGIAAEFYAALGETAHAAALMPEAEAAADEVGHAATRIRVRRARAHLALRAGEADRAVEAAQAAASLGLEMPLLQPYEHGQSLLLLGSACQAAGDPDRAAAAWGQARELFSGLEARWYLARANEVLRSVGTRR